MDDNLQARDGGDGHEAVPRPPDAAFLAEIGEEIDAAGGPLEAECPDAVGRTMFDLPNSKDNVVPVLLPPDNTRHAPNQALVRIRSADGRVYLGVVVEGPFHEPDGLRADAPIIVTATVHSAVLMPKYHGRVHVEIMGEVLDDVVVPPRFRPLPNSYVFVLDEEETAQTLGTWREGDVRLGMAIGHENLPVGLPPADKAVLPRHLGVLGTTGGGKSTTVSGLIGGFQRAGLATILLDTEGEYTTINQPTSDPRMLKALERTGLKPAGVENTHVYHLVGRETSNPDHPSITPFSLRFSDLSPFALVELLEMNEPQQERFLKAYDLAQKIMREMRIFPVSDEEFKEVMEWDEQETGYPRLKLVFLYDVVRACAHKIDKQDGEPEFSANWDEARKKQAWDIVNRAADLPKVPSSWRVVQGKLGRLLRLRIFDHPRVGRLNYKTLTQPGQVSIIDLSDTDSPQINNLVIAELLRGVMEEQEANYAAAAKGEDAMRRVMVVIEEAHEFLSDARIRQMPVLFQQVARIARRGRKRWLGLAFITQLPQHLPDEVLGLINSAILHKIGDANVVSRLKRSMGGLDEGLWQRLPNLAPGQAIVTLPTLARPLLVAIDPTPCQLRMVD